MALGQLLRQLNLRELILPFWQGSLDRITRWKVRVAGLAILLLAGATYFALRQGTPPQFEQSVSFPHIRWWLTPIERAPALRPPSTSAGLNGVFVLPSNTQLRWAVGQQSTILRSTDGGVHWHSQLVGPDDLHAIVFVDAQKGWAVGDDGTILHTEDGGTDWQVQTTGEMDNAPSRGNLTSVTFANPQLGWAVGGEGTILHTVDGGLHWAVQPSGTKAGFGSVAFTSQQSGWAAGFALILHTEDGGASWQTQPTDSRAYFGSIIFVGERSGWAVGTQGTILHTEDGGAHWQQQASGTPEDLTSVVFVDKLSGWVAGFSGTILHTEDGGAHWRIQPSGTSQYFRSMSFSDPQTGSIVGDSGANEAIILQTQDGGEHWDLQSDGSVIYFNSVAFVNARSGWIVGGDGTILHTNDGGAQWDVQSSGTSNNLFSSTFPSDDSGWALGADQFGAGHTILHTDDRGTHWQVQFSTKQFFLWSIFFLNRHSGWATSSDGTILHTEDGGAHWLTQPSGKSQSLNAITFVNAQLGWIVGANGTILHTEDGGTNWQDQSTGGREYFSCVAFADPKSGWTLDRGGIFHTEDGGKHWQNQLAGNTLGLRSLAVVNAQSVWVSAEGGIFFHTEDGGQHWQKQLSQTQDQLNSITFANARSGWAVGQSGTILHTEDSGSHWQSQGYSRSLAPWFFVTVLAAAIALFWSCSPSPPLTIPAIEEIANSDSPVASLTDDALGYGPLVERLRRFIQNPKTAPPLVLALQAPWGMGKSSVMRMLESELRNARAAVTVWFNAWHHQKEDQLLACLLEAVKKDGVPPWFSPIGISFRFDLFRVRLFSNVDRLVLTVLTCAVLVLEPVWPHFQLYHQLNLPEWSKTVGLGILAWLISQPLIAFKADPDKLMERGSRSLLRAVKELLSLPSLIGKSDIRQEFSNNLKDVVNALSPQRLVIFLDDLDRCKPEQVVQILEAINFLSSVSACFIVVGADYKKIESLVGMQFERIAVQEYEDSEIPFSGEQQSVAEEPVSLRLAYAKNYLRKIVNLRINLRHPLARDYDAFLRRKPQDLRNNWRSLQRALILVFAVIAIWGFFAVRKHSPTPRSESGSTALGGKSSQTLIPPRGEIPQPDLQTTSASSSGAEPPPEPSSMIEDRDNVNLANRRWLAIGTSVLTCLAFLVYVLSRPKRREEARDPKSFSDALESHAAEILQSRKTPREIRRFLNYLRLVATSSGAESTEDIEKLRSQIPDFDFQLVALATSGADSIIQAGIVNAFFLSQCQLFGIDPETFNPLE